MIQKDINPAITSYVDALYFTLAILTTTGFGDITMVGPMGRLLASIIMIFGVGLFVTLAVSIFRPSKTYYECKKCGLTHHDSDASNCKHCGKVVKIKTEGA